MLLNSRLSILGWRTCELGALAAWPSLLLCGRSRCEFDPVALGFFQDSKGKIEVLDKVVLDSATHHTGFDFGIRIPIR